VRVAVRAHALTANWRNGQSAGRDRAAFVAPGIGEGEVVCSPDTQQVQFRPYDQQSDTAMWTTRVEYHPDDGRVETDVRNRASGRLHRPLVHHRRRWSGSAAPATMELSSEYIVNGQSASDDDCYVAGSLAQPAG